MTERFAGIGARLVGLVLLVLAALALVGALVFFSFERIETLIGRRAVDEVSAVTGNAALSREFAAIHSRINLLSLACRSEQPPEDLLVAIAQPLARLTDEAAEPRLAQALRDFGSTASALIAQCRQVSAALRDSIALDRRLLADLLGLENIGARQIVEQTLLGRPIDHLEQLMAQVAGSRETALLVGRRVAGLRLLIAGAGGRDPSALALLDEVSLRLQSLMAPVPAMQRQRDAVLGTLREYRSSVLALDQALRRFDELQAGSQAMRDGLLREVGALDASATQRANALAGELGGLIQEARQRMLVAILAVAVLALGLAAWLIRSNIRRPLDQVLAQVAAIRSGLHGAPASPPRADEWGAIQSALSALSTELDASVSLRQRIIDTAPIRVFWKGADLRYLGCNPAFAHDLGLVNPNQVVGLDDQALRAQGCPVPDPGTDHEVLASGAARLGYESRRTGVDGRVSWERHSRVALRNAQGDIVGVLGIYDDITEGKRIEADLAQALAAARSAATAKSRFFASVSHEIRTPLNAVLGMLKLLQATTLTTRQADYVAKSKGAARSLLLLINDILDFSKIEADRLELDIGPLDLDQLLRNLSVILASTHDGAPIELIFDIDPAVPMRLRGDTLRLQQVLLNLAGNALKFTPAGEVVLSVRLHGCRDGKAQLAFSVRDTGIGIDPERQGSLFDGFAQADASIARRFGGTGLGLAISQRLVGLMGGRIHLSSTPGEGSVFGFEIPLALDSDQPTLPPAEARERRCALIIDDHGGARAALGRMAESLGWTALLAADPVQAQAIARTAHEGGTPVDIVFLDAGIAHGGPQPFALALPARPGEPAPATVLLMSSHDSEARELEAESLPGTRSGFLVKPVIASMLRDALQDAHSDVSRDVLRRAMARPSDLPLAGLRLLLVEDNANNRQVAQELLESEGALVSLAHDGQEGLAAVLRADPPFDAVLMDIRMPVMDGHAAARRIREIAHLRSLPIIAMTANVSAEDRLASEQAGMNAHVGKPFVLRELCAVILQLCGRAERTPRRGSQPVELSGVVAELARAAGLDVDTAIHRFSGQVGVYGRMLRSFLTELPESIDHIGKALDAGRLGSAGAAFHSLKGVAGNIGARALSELAEAGEQGCEANAPRAVLGDLLAAIRDAGMRLGQHGPSLVDALLGSLGGLARAGVDDSLPSPAADLQPVLDRLLPLLRRSDMRAVDVLEELRSLSGSQPLSEALAELEMAVDRLDFELAAAICEGFGTQSGWSSSRPSRHHPV
ncbi:MAG: response regulator [Betaproteobacteria bacterium]|nr:response regulator [Betaproteobacteria bacterium]